MNSFIISSQNEQKGFEKALKICKDFEIDRFDTNIIEQDFEAEKVKAIGIEKVRQIQKKVFLKPLKSNFKAVIIKNSESLTIPAQNALLKILEEPPIDTIIILLAKNKDLLLSTVISRCQVFEIDGDEFSLSETEIDQNLKTIKSLIEDNLGSRLKLAQDISKSKEDATLWLKKIILSLRKKMIENPSNEPTTYLNILTSFQKTYTIINTTNVNPRFTIENLLSNL